MPAPPTGLTWAHPRAWRGLEAAARVREAITTTIPEAQVVAGLEQDHARSLRRHEHQEVR